MITEKEKRKNQSNHETMIWIGITYKKIPCHVRGSACKWSVVKNAKKILKLC